MAMVLRYIANDCKRVTHFQDGLSPCGRRRSSSVGCEAAARQRACCYNLGLSEICHAVFIEDGIAVNWEPHDSPVLRDGDFAIKLRVHAFDIHRNK